MAAGQEPRCRYCGCTEDRRRTVPGGDTCVWYTAGRDVCSCPGCVTQFHIDDVAARRKDFLKLGRRKPKGNRRRVA
jgi:hypothetical protein